MMDSPRCPSMSWRSPGPSSAGAAPAGPLPSGEAERTASWVWRERSPCEESGAIWNWRRSTCFEDHDRLRLGAIWQHVSAPESSMAGTGPNTAKEGLAPPDPEMVRAQLNRILADPRFVRS